ncbi:MAG: nucleotide exchange factor GrpE [Candidatus Magasanikbacteria bacterium]|nr:nucleotide exchange factor GrpE [Candidatus Magasanikbacteria bacterium]
MTDEQTIAKHYPPVTTGAIIINQAGKIFLMRSPKFKNKLVIPGGHVNWGESLADCLQREIKEETGLTIRDPEFVRPVEFIFSDNYDPAKHIIPLDYVAYTDDPEDAVRLDGREGTEYFWLTREEIASHPDLESTTRETIAFYHQRERERQQCAEYKQGWQRAVADYQNLQKEVERRRAEWAAFSEQQILAEFLPVYDNFRKAGSVPPGTGGAELSGWAEGIQHIMKQFGSILKAHGVEEIKTVGELFDPACHEAMGEEAAGGVESGRIIREVEGGYRSGERVIKPAKVIVVK